MSGWKIAQVRNDKFILNPTDELNEVASFLGLNEDSQWLKTCSAKIYKGESRSRKKVVWSPKYVKQVLQLCYRTPSLERFCKSVEDFLGEVSNKYYIGSQEALKWDAVIKDFSRGNVLCGLEKGVKFFEQHEYSFSHCNIFVSKAINEHYDLAYCKALTQKAIQINPSSYEAYKNYALIEASLGNFDLTSLYIEKYLNIISRNYPDVKLLMLSHIYNLLGDIEQAIQKVQDAIAIKDDNPVLYSHLGNLLKKKGDFSGAKEAYKKAIAIS